MTEPTKFDESSPVEPSEAPWKLTQDDLQALIERPPEVDLTAPAFGTHGAPATTPADLQTRETSTYTWARENYHDFVDRIKAADLEGPIAVAQLREYLMRQLIALSGHPDSKTSIKAIELLGKVKNVGLFDEKRAAAQPGSNAEASVRRELAEIIGAFKK